MNTPQQINPPFDGRAPCPMCQEEVRGFAALLHNTFMRWGEQKMWGKLNDIREFHQEPIHLTVPHPATIEMEELRRDLITALGGMTRGTGRGACKITWTQDVCERITFMRERVRQVLIALEPLSDAHFADARHSHNRPNVIRGRRGSKGDLYETGSGSTEYDYSVDVVTSGGDLVHTVCGTHLAVHDHFKQKLESAPGFYEQVWCPTCRLDAPIAQFTLGSRLAA